MNMRETGRNAGKVILLGAALGLLLSGCGGFGKIVGASKRPPDEFTVISKTPLIVPPEFNLRPPADGQGEAKDVDPQMAAMEALFPETTSVAQRSGGEDLFLRQAGADDVGVDVRSDLGADDTVVKKGVFTETILYDDSVDAGGGGVQIDRGTAFDEDE